MDSVGYFFIIAFKFNASIIIPAWITTVAIIMKAAIKMFISIVSDLSFL